MTTNQATSVSQGWYVARDGQQEGPFDWPVLQKLAADHELKPDDLIWTEGAADWVPASSVNDLFDASPASLTQPPQIASIPAPQPLLATLAAGVTQTSANDYTAFGRTQLTYAGFWMRFMASFIDGLIILAIGFAMTTAFVWYVGHDAVRSNAHTVGNFIRLIFITVAWIYCCMLESGSQQSTIGKRLLGLKVTDLSGNQISFGRATGRHFGKIISQLILMIGYVMMVFTPNNQCLHDLMAGCVVVKTEWA